MRQQERKILEPETKQAMNNIGHEETTKPKNFSCLENWRKVVALEKMYNNAIKRR